ncbi:DAK2 domain-containing protein [Sodalis sp. RH21]|uniref:DAK2 domain-containing protein n=1 Tax=unclassified Sodalis (in: enterobacteria) TaxID=2636512 RepID=UPI0039B67D26
MKMYLSPADCRQLIAAWYAELSRQREALINLDQQVGDGDLGITMQKAFAAAAQVEPTVGAGIEKLLIQCGIAMAKAAPSTMGTLMATGFMRGGKALPADTARLDGPALALFFTAFTQGIAERGKARPGDKTVLDVLLPASQALHLSVARQSPLSDGVNAAYLAAQAGLEATRAMVPQQGKAACFVEKSLGIPDPGGAVAVILFHVLDEFVRAG